MQAINESLTSQQIKKQVQHDSVVRTEQDKEEKDNSCDRNNFRGFIKTLGYKVLKNRKNLRILKEEVF